MTRDSPTGEERFAAEVIRRVGGWECTYADSESDGAVDWWLERDGMRVGGVEVTILGDPSLFAAMSAAGGVYRDLPSAKWAWMLTYTGKTQFKEAWAHLTDLVALCEAEDVTEPEQLDYVHDSQPCVLWYDRSNAHLLGFRDAHRHASSTWSRPAPGAS